MMGQALRSQAVQLLSCQQLAGGADWVPAFQARVMGAVWVFHPDGTFEYVTADRPTLVGRYQGQAPYFSFQAEMIESGATTASVRTARGSARSPMPRWRRQPVRQSSRTS